MANNNKPPSAGTLGGDEIEKGTSNDVQPSIPVRSVERRRRRRVVIEISEYERAMARRLLARRFRGGQR